MRRETAGQAEAHRRELLERQQQLDALRQRNGELEGRAAELIEQRDLQARELEAMRQRMEAAAVRRPPSSRTRPRGPAKSKASKPAP